jgi:hypothetical protein
MYNLLKHSFKGLTFIISVIHQIICTSIYAFVFDLQYNEKILGSGAQTSPPGPSPAGEVLVW